MKECLSVSDAVRRQAGRHPMEETSAAASPYPFADSFGWEQTSETRMARAAAAAGSALSTDGVFIVCQRYMHILDSSLTLLYIMYNTRNNWLRFSSARPPSFIVQQNRIIILRILQVLSCRRGHCTPSHFTTANDATGCTDNRHTLIDVCRNKRITSV